MGFRSHLFYATLKFNALTDYVIHTVHGNNLIVHSVNLLGRTVAFDQHHTHIHQGSMDRVWTYAVQMMKAFEANS